RDAMCAAGSGSGDDRHGFHAGHFLLQSGTCCGREALVLRLAWGKGTCGHAIPQLPALLGENMHHLDLILTLTGSLTVALALGYLTHRLGLSPLVGYLLAGIAVGPYTPGFVANRALAEQLAEVGVILLMFGVGLQFHLTELLAVRRVALPGAV